MVFINSFSDEAGGITRHPWPLTWPLEMLTIFTFEEQPGRQDQVHDPLAGLQRDAGRAEDLRHQPRQHAHGLERNHGSARRLSGQGSLRLGPRQINTEDHMSYVDGFIVPVPKKKTRGLSQHGEERRARSGAITARWNFGRASPTTSRSGRWTSFPRSVKLKRGETVVFSYIVYKSRKDRDRVLAKVMKDKRLAKMMNPKAMPFDAKRMIYGGFKTRITVEAGRSEHKRSDLCSRKSAGRRRGTCPTSPKSCECFSTWTKWLVGISRTASPT